MKRILVVAAVAALALVLVPGAGAAELTAEQYARAEQNLLDALASDNTGLCQSAAFMLGELKSKRAVIPLMRMLHEADNERCKCVAALALCRIGDPIGTYAVKREAQLNMDHLVRCRAAWFYEEYVQAGTFLFIPYGITYGIMPAPEVASR